MTLVLLTFFSTLTIVVGGYWIIVSRPEANVAERLRLRLQVKTNRPVEASVVKGAAAQVGAGVVGTLVKWHREHAVKRAARLIDSAGMRTDPARLIAGTGIALILVVILLEIAHAGALLALVAGLMTPLVPYAYLRYAAQARLSAFEESFPDAIGLMARALRAGHALTTTLVMVADEMAEPVKSEFRVLYEQHQYGLPLSHALRRLTTRIPLIDVRFFATAVLMQRETGGNLAEILDNLGAVTRDRFRIRRQLRVLTAQGRITGWILVGLPIGLAAILYAFNSGHMNAFVKDSLGIRMLEGAAVLELIGAVLIRKIVAVEY